MNEAIIFGDIEAALIAYIDGYTTATVAATVPTTRSGDLVVVRRVGGAKRDLVTDSATVTFECWSALPSSAATLCQLVRAYLHALEGQTIGGITIYRTQEFAGPALLPDPVSDVPRYVFTASVDYRGQSTS